PRHQRLEGRGGVTVFSVRALEKKHGRAMVAARTPGGPDMRLSSYLGIGAIVFGFTLAAAPGCSSDSTGGAGGGGGSAFMEVAPCASESDYMATTTITATAALKYSPACVKVSKGAMVKFMMDFTVHPLKKSTKRGDTANNPIADTATGTEASFTFPKAGFYGFFCNFHGPADDGKNMAGVVWVTE